MPSPRADASSRESLQGLAARPRRRGLGVVGWLAVATGAAAVAVLAAAAAVLFQIGLPHARPGSAIPAQRGGPPAAPASAAEMLRWDAAEGDPKSYSIDGYTITLSTGHGAAGSWPVIRVTAPDGRAGLLDGDPNPGLAAASFGLGRIDPQADGEQLLVSTPAGTQHHLRLLELTPGGWRIVEIAAFQTDPATSFPKDIDGDGTPDIAARDDRFLGAFADPAASRLPPRFIDVVGGAAVDVSARPGFAPAFRRDLKTAEAGCLNHANSQCAAMVADAARLGLRDWAWRLMLANYNGAVVRLWPVLCRSVAAPGRCPPAQQVTFTDMPDALAGFLVAAGYAAPNAPPPPGGAFQPGFDCATADRSVTVLICNTASLSEADKAVSDAYAQALALSPDPSVLEAEQQAWLQRRDQAPADDATLSALYQARLQDLQAGAE